MTLDKVSIIIPAYNEESSVGVVVRSLAEKCRDAEIIVVNDGSRDATARVAAEAGAKVLVHHRCRGYGASLRTGIMASSRDYVLFCDADGQHSAEDVLRVAEACRDCAMVVGARDPKSYVPPVRYPGKVLLNRFANMLAGEKIPDLNSGLRIVRREVIQKYLHLMPRGFSFSTTSTFALLKGGHLIKWIPIRVEKRAGTSLVRQWKDGPRTILLMIRLSVLFEPLKVFLAADAVLLVMALASVGMDIRAHGFGKGLGDVSILLCISTLVVFLFGLLCDQVSALRREIRE